MCSYTSKTCIVSFPTIEGTSMKLKIKFPEIGIEADSIEGNEEQTIITPIFYKRRINVTATGFRVCTFDEAGTLLFNGHIEVDGKTGAVSIERRNDQRVSAPVDLEQGDDEDQDSDDDQGN